MVCCSDEEEGMAEVQLLLKRVMAHKKATSRKKEMRILQVNNFPMKAHEHCAVLMHVARFGYIPHYSQKFATNKCGDHLLHYPVIERDGYVEGPVIAVAKCKQVRAI